MDEELRLMLVAMSRRIEGLEREVARLKGAGLRPEHVSMQVPASAEPQAAEPEVQPVSAPAAQTLSTAQQSVSRQLSAPRQEGSIESAIGTKWIGRIGMIAMLFGIGFLLKYSFDNNLIGETGRIILGILAGIAFIGAGEYLSRRVNMGLYAQILTGGGLSILYLSIYAGYAFYKLIPQTAAFGAFIAVTTTGITLSVRYNAIVISIMSMIGGFLTPVMLSTGENRPIPLFSYILLLDAGFLVIAWLRRWRLLTLLSLLLTILMFSSWQMRFFTAEQQLLAFGISTGFYLLFNIAAIIKGHAANESEKYFDPVIISVSTSWYLLTFFSQNYFISDWHLKSFVLGLSVLTILAAGLVLRLDSGRKEGIYCYAGWSVVLSVVALLIIFERQWQAMAMATEMLVLCYVGMKINKAGARYASYAAGLIVAVLFFRETQLTLAPFEHYMPILNFRFLICGLLIGTFYAMLYMLNREKELLPEAERFILPGLLCLTQVFSVFLLSVEATDYFRHARAAHELVPLDSRYAKQLSLSVVWAVYASVMIGVGIARNVALLRLLGIGLIGITILKVFLLDLSELRTIYRIISFVVLGFILLGVSYFYNRFRQRIFGEEGTR